MLALPALNLYFLNNNDATVANLAGTVIFGKSFDNLVHETRHYVLCRERAFEAIRTPG